MGLSRFPSRSEVKYDMSEVRNYFAAFFFAAQYFFILRACAFRWAGVKVRPRLAGGSGVAPLVITAKGLFGRPRRLTPP